MFLKKCACDWRFSNHASLPLSHASQYDTPGSVIVSFEAIFRVSRINTYAPQIYRQGAAGRVHARAEAAAVSAGRRGRHVSHRVRGTVRAWYLVPCLGGSDVCVCACLFLRQSRLWVGVPKPDPRIHHPTFPQQARGAAAGAAGKPGAEGHGPAPDAATKKRSGSKGQRIEQGTDRWRRLST